MPTKLANKSDVLEIPPELEPREYYSSLCVRFEILVASFQRRPDTGKSYALLLTSAYSSRTWAEAGRMASQTSERTVLVEVACEQLQDDGQRDLKHAKCE